MTPRIPLHDQRIRQRQIHDKLRALGSNRPILADSLYERGELAEPGWKALHLFRDDRIVLNEAKLHGQVRNRIFAKSSIGYSMRHIEVERALLVQRAMTPERFADALVLIGEMDGEVEPDKARWTAGELCQLYSGDPRAIRWKDGRINCATAEK